MSKIAVVIPAYNAERTIAVCLDSVLNQSFEDFEIVLCDDDSSDGTLEAARAIADKDSRVRILRIDHGGAGAARNAGMDLAGADTEYLYFLDADDYIAPDALSRLYNAAATSDADVVITKSHYLDDETGEETDIDFAIQGVPFNQVLADSNLPESPFQSFVGWPWDKLFSFRFIREKGLRFQPLRSSNDAAFVFLALCEARRILCIDEDLVAHRTNNASSLEHTRSKSWNNAIAAMEKLREEILSRHLYDRAWTSYANWVSHFSYWNMATLDSDALTPEVVHAFDAFMATVQLADTSYFNDEDRLFASLCRMNRDEVIREYIKKRWRDEQELKHVHTAHNDHVYAIHKEADMLILDLQEAIDLERHRVEQLNSDIENIKGSYSWRVGNALIKPLSRIRRMLKR